MSSTNRSRLTAGNRAFGCVLAVLLALAVARPAVAAEPAIPTYWFGGTSIVFDRAQTRGADVAVATDDSGLERFLATAGATIASQAGQNYIVVTSNDRRTISFSLGDAQYTVDGVTHVAPFAPYVSGRSTFLPFVALARALAIDAVPDAGDVVLQPQLGSIDVRSQNQITTLTLRTATALRFKRMSAANDPHLILSLGGVGTSLDHERDVSSASLKDVTLTVDGSARNPSTTVDIEAIAGSTYVLAAQTRNSISISFAPAGVALDGTPFPAQSAPLARVSRTSIARATPAPVPTPALALAPTPPPVTPPSEGSPADPIGAAASAASPVPNGPPANITGFKTDPSGDAATVHVAVTGDTTYEWHRLTDNRWYVDVKPATLVIPSQDVPLNVPAIVTMRLKSFVGPHDRQPTVRIALTMPSPRTIALSAESGGFAIAVDDTDDPAPQRVGYGQLQGGQLVSLAAPPFGSVISPVGAPVPIALAPAGWKFGPAPVANGPLDARLIVIDPGHGGSDAGSQHNGLSEKALNLDMAKRLRTILVARGWNVRMTRETDVDVYRPNDSGRDELQARDDIANAAGARLFISIHSNAFVTSGPHGTTTYYYKPDSIGFANAIHARLASTLPTKDDGVIHENYYVIRHASMPAVLIESAFLSNPVDAGYLRSEAFLQRLALAVADGVGDYTQTPTSQPLSSNAMPPDGQ